LPPELENQGASGGTISPEEAKKNQEDLTTLYKTLEQQYALIGEMDAENVRLATEVGDMKKERSMMSGILDGKSPVKGDSAGAVKGQGGS